MPEDVPTTALVEPAGDLNYGRAVPSDLWFVHPELRSGAREVTENLGGFTAALATALPDLRTALDESAEPPSALVPYEKRIIPGAPGAPGVVVYIINGKAETRRGGILHTHAGGFMVGSALAAVPHLQDIAAALDCCIVTVDYRLAPETTWRGSTGDNYAGLAWLNENADALGVDRSRIIIMGESAGAGHAALLALAARDRGEVKVLAQVLIAPMLDDRTGSSRAVPAPLGTIAWTAERNRLGWQSFLGQEPGTTAVPAKAVPARTPDLSGLPPTFIGIGAIDLFVQESIDYAQRLIAAGVPTELVVVPGAYHGFDAYPIRTAAARTFNDDKMSALRRFLNDTSHLN